MSDRAIRVWTEFRPRFALAVVTVFSAGVLVGVETGWSRVAFATVALVGISAALVRDGYVGIVIGLVGAAALVLLKRLSGDFASRDFYVIAAQVAAVIVAPWVVGILGQHLRSALAHLAKPVVGTISPVANALGVLGADVGMFRLQEELARWQRTGEPLALAVIEARPLAYTTGADDDAALDDARRAMARNVESVTNDLDVVFAIDNRTLAVVMPATDATAGAEALGRIVLVASAATFSGLVDRSRHVVAEHLAFRTALVVANRSSGRAQAFVDQALELLAGQPARGLQPG